MLRARRARHPERDEAGLSLAEVLVATAVIAIGLVALASVIPIAAHAMHEGQARSTATFLAEQRLEELRHAVWTAVGDVDCLGVSSAGPPESTTCGRDVPTACSADTRCVTFADESAVVGYPAYARTVRISDCAAGSGCAGAGHADLRRARVTVTYRPLRGAGGLSTGTVTSAVLELHVAKRS